MSLLPPEVLLWLWPDAMASWYMITQKFLHQHTLCIKQSGFRLQHGEEGGKNIFVTHVTMKVSYAVGKGNWSRNCGHSRKRRARAHGTHIIVSDNLSTRCIRHVSFNRNLFANLVWVQKLVYHQAHLQFHRPWVGLDLFLAECCAVNHGYESPFQQVALLIIINWATQRVICHTWNSGDHGLVPISWNIVSWIMINQYRRCDSCERYRK